MVLGEVPLITVGDNTVPLRMQARMLDQRLWKAVPTDRHTAASSNAASPARGRAAAAAVSYASPLALKRRPRPRLVWELVWEAPAEEEEVEALS